MLAVKSLKKPPSDILNVRRLSDELTGLGDDDDWTCYQFDNAVTMFGRWVESKLSEYENGKPVYTLERLLSKEWNAIQYEDFKNLITSIAGGIERY